MTAPSENPLLTMKQINMRLEAQPGWSVSQPDMDEGVQHENLPGTYLYRQLKFPSFANAIEFMAFCREEIDALGHHPNWENVYDKLTVRSTTHDANNCVTGKDFALAELIGRKYIQFALEKWQEQHPEVTEDKFIVIFAEDAVVLGPFDTQEAMMQAAYEPPHLGKKPYVGTIELFNQPPMVDIITTPPFLRGLPHLDGVPGNGR